MSRSITCRFCGSRLTRSFIDLGVSPLCQSHITNATLNQMEPFYPLHAMVCETCLLVQLDQYVMASDIFSEYAYFSSFSDSWVQHAQEFVEMARHRFDIDQQSFVVEVASNDGYLLQHFLTHDVPCLGVEPAENVAAAAKEKGIESLCAFFGAETAESIKHKYRGADLIVGNNVLAHVPDLNDFVAGMKILLAENGVICGEFPHLLELIEQSQFDTIYHEHFSYFSFLTVRRVFRQHGLDIFDVEQLPTHGGSLRIYAQHRSCGREISSTVKQLLDLERAQGYECLETYSSFQSKVNKIKHELLAFLIDAKRDGKRIAGYGAPGKGNTLLNYCGIGRDFLDYTVDRNPYKQGKYTPGTRIPILAPERIRETRPDYLLVLPWNLRDEIAASHAYISQWGGRFVVPIPELEVFDAP
ncbi:MAG: methyltransferase domain-containing protein [Pseudomonadales bacterium]